jgi:nicotinate-nucleotide pyrophosphorylase (carboxylating)
MRIEVEADTLAQVDEALQAGADIILVDNMPTERIREAVTRARGRAKIEISGGVTLERIPELAATGADFVSVGALTHSAPAIDISFEIGPA